jgi:hypothetical protein
MLRPSPNVRFEKLRRRFESLRKRQIGAVCCLAISRISKPSERVQGQTASGPCLGASREGSPLFGLRRTGCQGVQGEWRTTTLRVGMKGVGETSLSRAESPLRVWESWTSPKVAAGGQGPGACPWRMRSSNVEPKGRSASYLVSK